MIQAKYSINRVMDVKAWCIRTVFFFLTFCIIYFLYVSRKQGY